MNGYDFDSYARQRQERKKELLEDMENVITGIDNERMEELLLKWANKEGKIYKKDSSPSIYDSEYLVKILSLTGSACKFNLCFLIKNGYIDGDVITRLLLGNRPIHNEMEIKSKLEKELNSFKYIPYEPSKFLVLLNLLKSKKLIDNSSFVDVGCGIGDKVLLAKLFGFQKVTGIELNDETHVISKFLLGRYFYISTSTDWRNKDISLLHKNAFDVDYKDYSLIYMYMPMYSTENMINLYNHILSTMNKDAILVEVLPNSVVKSRINGKVRFYSLDNSKYHDVAVIRRNKNERQMEK